MKNNLLKLIFPLMVLAAVAVVIFNFDLKSEISEKENKTLAKFPNVNPFHEKFHIKMDDYINDRIGLRLQALELSRKFFGNINAKIITPKTNVLIGKNEWLFLNAMNNTMYDFARTSSFSEKQLELMKKSFEEVSDWCIQNGIKFYMFIPPNKSDMYPEYYVKHFKQLPLKSKYEQFRDYIGGGNLPPLVDVLEPLKEAKKLEQNVLYYQNDTHWNSNGAYVGYKTLMDVIKKDFPNIEYHTQDDFEYKSERNSTSDLLILLGEYLFNYEPQIITKLKKETDFKLVEQATSEFHANGINSIKETANTKGPKIFVVHDSFYMAMEPFVIKSASRIVNRWIWFDSPLYFKEEILKEKPDILIWEIQQRFLQKMTTENYNNFNVSP